MPIVDITLRETKAVRNVVKGESAKPASRTSDIKIEGIRELKNTGNDSNNAVVIEFFYHAKYGLKDSKNNFGSIEVRGDMIYVESKEGIKKLLNDWNNKKEDTNLMGKFLNVALSKSTIEAIEQAAKVGLPSPIPLPVLRPNKPASKTSAS